MDELSEAELRYYNDLFKICSETDGAGKIPALKATSLFRSANLSSEIINKITALAGIPQTALHLSRQQFYGCLKLIAAYQAAVPLREEILTTSVNLPLPQFSWIDPATGPSSGAGDSSSLSSSILSAAGSGSGTGAGGSQTGTLERNGYSEVNRRASLKMAGGVTGGGGGAGSTTQDSSASTGGEMTNSDQPSTDSEVEHNDDPVNMIRGERERHTVGMLKGGGIVMIGNSHPLVGGGAGGGGGHGGGHGGGGGGGSPEAWSTASDSPTPTNSVAERPWANQTLWQGLVCEEQRQLLGTEEESSDRHSSDEDEQEIDLEYFYQISQTQKDYYLKQFRTIQPDVHGLVSGPVARVFFEKSRIPIDELRHIWQMCDVTRDGALNLAEFTAAMHLVVLRRNNIPVPATLPPCLLPTLLQHSLLQPAAGGASGSSALPASASAEVPTTTGGSGSGAAAGANVSLANERTEPAEADLLHLESDDNVESSSRKRFDAHKDYQRMVPVPDTLAFAKVAAPAGGGAPVGASVAAHDASPPSVSSATGVGSSSGTTGSVSVANATKGSSNSGSNSSSAAVSTTGGRKTPPNVSPPVLAQHHQQHAAGSAQKVKQSADHPVTPPNTKTNKEWNSTTKEWTKFMESPTSNVSSPGPKPVNFDLQRTTQAIVSNPHIVHPVPLRVTPVGAEAVDNGSLVYGSDGTGSLMVVQTRDDSSPKQQTSQQQQQQPPLPHHHSTPRDSLTNSGDLRAIQRPQPKKPPSKGVGAIPPPPQRDSGGAHPASSAHSGNDSMTVSLDASGFAASSSSSAGGSNATATIERLPSLAKKQSVDQQPPPPPLPPPRPSAHRHTRSSSLDLNKLKLTTNSAAMAPIGDPLKMPPPPEVPPRVTPTGEAPTGHRQPAHGFADFTHFPSGASSGQRIGSIGDSSNITTIHLDAAGNMTHHSTPRGSGTLPKSLVMHQPRNSAFEVYRKPHADGRLVAAAASAARGSQSPQSQQPPLVTSRSVDTSGAVMSGGGDYDKRISALSDSLRQVRFKANDPPPVMPDVLKQLKEQNLLLLRICNDLSEELLHIQQKREDIRIKIELQEQILGGGGGGGSNSTTSTMLSTGPSSLPAVSSTSSSHTTNHHHSHHHANL